MFSLGWRVSGKNNFVIRKLSHRAVSHNQGFSQVQDVFESAPASSISERSSCPTSFAEQGTISSGSSSFEMCVKSAMERRRPFGLFLLVLGLFSVFHEGCCCGRNWLRYGNRCYLFNDVPMTYRDARLRCLEEGSDLASISSEGLLHFIAQHVATQEEGTFFWVGLLGYNETGDLLWLDGTAHAHEQPWVSLPPGSDGFTSACFTYNGAAVMVAACSQSYGAICSRNWVDWSNPTTRFCSPVEHPMHVFVGQATGSCLFVAPGETSGEVLEEFCQRFGAHFADLDTVLREGLDSGRASRVLSNGEPYWTSLRHNGTHVFFGNPANPLPYPLQNSGGVGDCVTVQFNFSVALQTHLYRAECGDQANVVCYHDVPLPSPPSAPQAFIRVADSSLTCPEGFNWKMDSRNNYCYWETSYETDHLSWSDAEAFCQSYGGHLASFHSKDDEKIGLSFQYGSLAHPYWIGLSLDADTETYVWADGSPLDYTNWAPGHPNHRDKRLRCVAMEAQEKHWVSSLCGILSWFICKVPRQARHYTSIRPTPAPLVPCDFGGGADGGQPYRFGGSCYSAEVNSVSWHEARSKCEDQGARLASIHTSDEVGFLIKLLHGSSLDSNRVWIGLNSFGTYGELRWADWTPIDFTYFGDWPQDLSLYQEKCYNMYANNGQWNKENCNAALGFVCKWANESVTAPPVPSTADPRIGNCKKGWMPYDDRCYYFGGVRVKDQVNWTEAARLCRDQGGELTSVRDDQEQAFLSYMLQNVESDAWIGFHDKIQTGRYYWLDNSEVKYTNWAVGEPSSVGITEECVKMVFDHPDSGVWKDDDCSRTYAYVCQSRRDPSLPKPAYVPSTQCLQPEGWLKLEDACYMLFGYHNTLTRDEAEKRCRREGGHLVSISDQKIKAAVQHLAVQLQTDFFIGLQYEASEQRFRWVNDFPVRLTHWEKNEPGVGLDGDTCFASTSEGYWKKAPCDQPLAYMCHIAPARRQKQWRYIGDCPETSSKWWAGRGSFCYLLEGHTKSDWFTANLMCLRHASHQLSIHSMSEIDDLRTMIGLFGSSAPKSVFLGLTRNKKGGFVWMDDSPVDFVNWEPGEPSASLEQQCVEMMTDTMKWRLTSCLLKRSYLCQDFKDTLVFEDIRTAQYTDAQDQPQVGLSVGAICAIVACVAVGILLLVTALFYRKRRGQLPRGHRNHDESVSFENALYKVDSANMEFDQEEL